MYALTLLKSYGKVQSTQKISVTVIGFNGPGIQGISAKLFLPRRDGKK